ncbi:hypothetical protein AGMMS50230_00800 [Spirochaetia bacterium]|nr:hypothetical protein AGMMS50230_00800 [Spirochaetia bacterium]
MWRAGIIFSDLIEKIKDGISRFPDLVKDHFRVVIIITAAFLVIILLLLVLAVVVPSHQKSETETKKPVSELSADTVPAEDFFLPYEPDFVPDVLLEREPRDGWTEEDARPFWTDPKEGNEEAWRKRIKQGVDSLLEHVP